jgi:integrase
MTLATTARQAVSAAEGNPRVLRSRTLRPGTSAESLSRYRDDVWQLTPAHPDLHLTIPALRWARFPGDTADGFKPFFLAALDHPYPPSPGLSRPNVMPSVGTFNYWFLDSLALASWMHSRGAATLNALTDADLDRYKDYVLGLDRAAGRKTDMLALVRTIWLYRPHLPDASQLTTGYPWGAVTAKQLVPQPAAGPDNKTPRIAPETMDALLAWALRMIEDVAPDIVSADREYQEFEAGAHPSQQIYHGMATQARLDLFVSRARKLGSCLPELSRQPGAINQGHLLRLVGVPKSKRAGLGHRQLQRLMDCGLPIAADDRLGPASAVIGGKPWRPSGITVAELPTLKRLLSAACFIVICYLSGMRPGEVLNLRRGCATTDPDTGELFIIGRPGKGYDRRPEPQAAADVTASATRPWTVVRPVHTAVEVLERLHPYDLLFPAAIVLERTDRTGHRHARTIFSINADLDDFVAWVNTSFPGPAGRPAIPPDPTKHIHASRLRRTLAYFIVRRPRGLIAAALQYGHVNTRVTLGYAGRADTSWLDDLAIERLEMVLDQTEQDWQLLNTGEHVSGPAAEDFRNRVATSARFAGRVVIGRRNIQRLLSHADPSIHHGEAMTCVWRPETAACRIARIEHGLPLNDSAEESECRSGCTNLAFTDRDIDHATHLLTNLEQRASDGLLPQPLRDRAAEQASHLHAIITRHHDSHPQQAGATT